MNDTFVRKMLNEAGSDRLAVVLLRVSAGIMFLRAAWPKLTALEAWPERMLGFLNFQENTPGWYRAFLDSLVIPNAELFGRLVAFGELAVGIGLVLGLLTRSALLAGLFMMINFMLAKGGAFWTPSNNDSYLVLILLALLFLRPGQFLGLDGWLRGKLAKAPRVPVEETA